MPGIAEGIYAQYYNSVVKLAKRQGGVSRPEIMKGLDVSRAVADRLIDECHLRRATTQGRTNYFTPTKATDKVLGTASANTNDQMGKEDATTMKIDETTPAAQEILSAMVGENRVADKIGNPPPAAKSAAVLDAEIKAIRTAIGEAETKARNAHETFIVQQAHANALGAKLQRALEARLVL